VPRLIIGCPIYARDWILPDWFESIEKQTFPLSDIGFVFELGPNDEPTYKVLFDWQAAHPEVEVFDISINEKEKHHHHPEKHRKWSYDKYYSMVEFRNNILERVRCLSPDKYFSLDSDILLEDPTTIEKLWDLTEQEDIDAVAPLMYMTPKGKDYPSVMTWVQNHPKKARRVPENYTIGELFQADVIMAAKMMSKPVYETVNYRFHKQGEDLGWSDDCDRAGFKLWSASYLYGAHIMSRAALEAYKTNGDDRTP
jgi:hypothetical protein